MGVKQLPETFSGAGGRRSCRVLLLVPIAILAFALVSPAGVTAAAAQPSQQAPASLGPGLGVAPSDTAVVAAATVCAKVAYKAGFSYTIEVSTSQGPVRQIVVAVAVGMAESGCNPSATGQNPGSVDRGLWQINSYYHSEVSDACAYQAQCNANAAWNISSKGTDWTPWSTYNNGAWAQYLSTARDAVSGFTITLKNRGAGTCLDAIASDVRNGGRIAQWACDSSDAYQQWTVVAVNDYNPVLRNVGAHTCLDAKASDVRSGGAIIQWACDTTGDAYQRWWVKGSGQYNTNGNANAGLENAGALDCLDARASDVGSGGAIIQWACDSSDSYQWWN